MTAAELSAHSLLSEMEVRAVLLFIPSSAVRLIDGRWYRTQGPILYGNRRQGLVLAALDSIGLFATGNP